VQGILHGIDQAGYISESAIVALPLEGINNGPCTACPTEYDAYLQMEQAWAW
jgi:hypothetical protein